MDTPDYQAPHAQKSFIEKLTQFLNGEPRNQDDLVEQLKSAVKRGLINPEVIGIFLGALQICDMKAREIMVPKSHMVVISIDDDCQQILKIINESAHSRFPVTGDHPDEIEGVLLAKDLLPLVSDGKLDKIDLRKIIRPVNFIPESKRLNRLLGEFRENRNHMAIVINEYGTVSGLITIEDVLEQIVGDIEDEHDYLDEKPITPINQKDFMVKAMTSIEDFNTHFNTAFADSDYDTIGGIVVHQFGHVPKRDESIIINNLLFKVLNADHRSVRLLQVTPLTA